MSHLNLSFVSNGDLFFPTSSNCHNFTSVDGILTPITRATQAFRRFSSRKSLPPVMISNNASTYLAAADELEELFSSESLLVALSRKGVTWRFIPKRAPWFGGFWERLIGLTKASIKKVLGRSYVSLLNLQKDCLSSTPIS